MYKVHGTGKKMTVRIATAGAKFLVPLLSRMLAADPGTFKVTKSYVWKPAYKSPKKKKDASFPVPK